MAFMNGLQARTIQIGKDRREHAMAKQYDESLHVTDPVRTEKSIVTGFYTYPAPTRSL